MVSTRYEWPEDYWDRPFVPVDLPPLQYQPPSPALADMLDQIARDYLVITAIPEEIFGCPAYKVSLKED